MERTVYNLLAMRELLMRRCKEFRIPIEWMHDSGIISKVLLLNFTFSCTLNALVKEFMTYFLLDYQKSCNIYYFLGTDNCTRILSIDNIL